MTTQSLSELLTLQEIVLEAKRRLAPAVWDFLTGGSESETTARRNRRALDSLALVPRVLRDVSVIDTSAALLGHRLALPIVLAPMGSVGLWEPGGALTVARAGERCGVLTLVSGVADPGMEAVARGAGGTLAYTLYVRGDDAWLERTVAEVKSLGYAAIAIVADAPYYSRRERDLMNRLVSKGTRKISYAALRKLAREEQPSDPNANLWGARITWQTVERIKTLSGLPLIVKGIGSAADAKRAVEHGADVVYVSNHGGRQLDHARATAEVLPEVREALGADATIIVDGGFCRGTDILKGIALGANAVGIGRLQGWALAAGHEEGLVRALEILEEELIVNMGLLGVTELGALERSFLHAVEPVGAAHPLNAFPVVMEKLRLYE